MFFHTPDTVDIVNQTANHNLSLGFTDGTSSAYQCVFSSNGNGVGESCYGIHGTTNCIVGSVDVTTMWRATLVSMDGDGFTINIPLAPPVGVRVGYLAIGGTLTGYKVGAFQAGAIGSQAITGLGFQPSGLITFIGAQTAPTANPTSLGSNLSNAFQVALGFSDGVNQRSNSYWVRGSTLTVKTSGRISRNDNLIAHAYSTTPTYTTRFSLTSFDVGGFTINNIINNTNRWVYYLAFGGAATQVGSFLSPTVSGTFYISGLPFDPAGVITASTWSPLFNTFYGYAAVPNAAGGMFSVGAATDPTEQITIGITNKDYTTVTVAGHHSESTKIMRRFSHDPFTTLQMDFAHQAMSTGQVAFNCTTPNGTTSQVSYMAIEGAPIVVPPSEPTGGSGDPDSPDSSFLFNMT
jgi:hypothetical protein